MKIRDNDNGIEYSPVVETLNNRIVELDREIENRAQHVLEQRSALDRIAESLARMRADRAALQTYVDGLDVL